MNKPSKIAKPLKTKKVVSTKKNVVADSIQIGISAAAREEIADGLSHLLADTYTLYLKTHNFHSYPL